MSPIKPTQRTSRRNTASQTGAYVVEFALLAMVFFTILYSVIELARVGYLFNTLQEVTRRAAHAAAGTDFRIENDMDALRWDAVFRTSPGPLALGAPIDDTYLRIDYLALKRAVDGTLTLTPLPDSDKPHCPVNNHFNCIHDPYAAVGSAACIRFVRVRVCDPADTSTCAPVGYPPLIPVPLPTKPDPKNPLKLIPVFTLPISTTIVKAETLGYVPGQPTCL